LFQQKPDTDGRRTESAPGLRSPPASIPQSKITALVGQGGAIVGIEHTLSRKESIFDHFAKASDFGPRQTSPAARDP
ncbi:MAG: hypothetical protein Q8R97_09245, partial [Brevundimonas sp.]|nr:hypothetical protein [Brevundimonas sp.]